MKIDLELLGNTIGRYDAIDLIIDIERIASDDMCRIINYRLQGYSYANIGTIMGYCKTTIFYAMEDFKKCLKDPENIIHLMPKKHRGKRLLITSTEISGAGTLSGKNTLSD